MPLTELVRKISNFNFIKNSETQELSSIFIAIRSEAIRCTELGEIQKGYILRLFSDIASYHFTPDDIKNPFKPILVFENKKSQAPEDLSDNDWGTLELVFDEIIREDFQARVCDLLWVYKKNRYAGEKAIRLYLTCSNQKLAVDNWHTAYECLLRATDLSASLGRSNDLHNQVIAHIINVMEKTAKTETNNAYLCKNLIELCLRHKVKDLAKIAQTCNNIIIQFRNDNDLVSVAHCWDLLAKIMYKSGDDDSGIQAQVNGAEAYVRLASSFLSGDKPSYLLASKFLTDAILRYRKIKGQQNRVRELHKTLLVYQEKMMPEMRQYSYEVDITEIAIKCRDQITGLNLIDAIAKLALIHPIVEVSNLRKQAEEYFNKFPLQHVFTQIQVNNIGKVVKSIPPGIADGDPERQTALTYSMIDLLRQNISLIMLAAIEPCRTVILDEHDVEQYDDIFYHLTYQNPLIPEDHFQLYAKGLFEGLKGDFVNAGHLLAPQLESCVRHLCATNGVITSGLNDKGEQEEYGLNKLAYLDEFKTIVGENIAFTLNWLLIEHTGANLRNLIAHGLVNDYFGNQAAAIYLWWFSLRLCLEFYFRGKPQHNHQEQSPTPPSGGTPGCPA